MSALALALAWGGLIAWPICATARRANAQVRARQLQLGVRHSRRHVLSRFVPTALRRVVVRIVAVRHERKDAREISRELPLVLDLLQVAVSAGCTPYRTLELAVVWGPPASGTAFGTALDATRVGSALRDALDALARAVPRLTPVTDVLVASERLGAPAGPALTRLAHDVRADLRRQSEARARKLPVKLLFPLVFLVLPAFGLLTVVPALLTALSHT